MNEKLRVTESSNSRETRCVYCHDSIERDEEISCPGCQVRLHEECCEQLTECPTIGCNELVSELLDSQVGGDVEDVRDDEDYDDEDYDDEDYEEDDYNEDYDEEDHESRSNFANFILGLKALLDTLPVYYFLTSLVCMLLGLGIGEIYYQIHDLSRFDGAKIIEESFYKTTRDGSRYLTVTRGYLDMLESRRLKAGASIGFFLGIALRLFYLGIASIGQQVDRPKR